MNSTTYNDSLLGMMMPSESVLLMAAAAAAASTTAPTVANPAAAAAHNDEDWLRWTSLNPSSASLFAAPNSMAVPMETDHSLPADKLHSIMMPPPPSSPADYWSDSSSPMTLSPAGSQSPVANYLPGNNNSSSSPATSPSLSLADLGDWRQLFGQNLFPTESCASTTTTSSSSASILALTDNTNRNGNAGTSSASPPPSFTPTADMPIDSSYLLALASTAQQAAAVILASQTLANTADETTPMPAGQQQQQHSPGSMTTNSTGTSAVHGDKEAASMQLHRLPPTTTRKPHKKRNMQMRNMECHNCHVKETPLWRRTADRAHPLCNACGLYYKQYGVYRTLPLRGGRISGAGSTAATKRLCPYKHNTHAQQPSKPTASAPSSPQQHTLATTTPTASPPPSTPVTRPSTPPCNNGGDASTPSPAVRGTPSGGNGQVCQNCGQNQTPLWRKNMLGQIICNACGLYEKMHKCPRPAALHHSRFQRRKREWPASSVPASATAAIAPDTARATPTSLAPPASHSPPASPPQPVLDDGGFKSSSSTNDVSATTTTPPSPPPFTMDAFIPFASNHEHFKDAVAHCSEMERREWLHLLEQRVAMLRDTLPQ